VAVTESRRQRRRGPLHKEGDGVAGGRYRTRADQQAAAVIIQKAGGGSAGGRYRKRAAVTGSRYRNTALGQDAPTPFLECQKQGI
jgi:hypothetical protein